MDGVVERTTGWTPEQLDLIKRTVADGTTDDEFAMFMHYCQQSGLDPLRKQAHCIVRDYTDKRGQHKRSVTTMTGIDGFRARAESFPDFLGCSSAVVFEGDNFSIDYGQNVVNHIANFPRKSKGPLGAWAIVRRIDRQPFIHWLSWPEIFDTFSPMHKKMPEVMAKKTVEAQALRHEYPEPFSGLYDPSELPREGEAILTSLDTPTPTPTPTASTPVNGQPVALPDPPEVTQPEQKEVEEEPPPIAGETNAVAVDLPTEAQVERWIDLLDWAADAGYISETVQREAIAWIDGPPKPSTKAVGAKIGVWKARRDRHDAEWESMKAVISDAEISDGDRDEATKRFVAWVMNPKSKFAGAANSPETIVQYMTDHQDLPL